LKPQINANLLTGVFLANGGILETTLMKVYHPSHFFLLFCNPER